MRKARGRRKEDTEVVLENEEEGERKSRRTVRRGVREKGGPRGGCRESVGKISQLVERERYKRRSLLCRFDVSLTCLSFPPSQFSLPTKHPILVLQINGRQTTEDNEIKVA